MNKKQIEVEKDATAEEEENVYMYYSLLTFPALLHSFYINRR